MIGPLFHKKAATSGGNSPLDGYKVAAGIIYLDNVSGTNTWKILSNADHAAINLDSVRQNTGQITIDYTSAGITKVVGGWISGGGDFASRGIFHELGMGATTTLVRFFEMQPYSQDCYLQYSTGTGTWSVTNLNSRAPFNFSLTSWNAGTGTIVLATSAAIMDPLTNLQAGGVTPGTFHAVLGSNSYSNTSVSIKVINHTGAVYAPVNNDRIFLSAKGKWVNPIPANEPNGRTSPTNEFTNTPYMRQITSFQDWTIQGGIFNNFQFLLIGQ